MIKINLFVKLLLNDFLSFKKKTGKKIYLFYLNYLFFLSLYEVNDQVIF